MPWNPADSQRKVQMLELFVEHGALRPDEYASLADFVPQRAAWSYLMHYHRNGLLKRGRNRAGRVIYNIGPNGARYLLWWKAQGYRVKVRSS